MERLDKYSYWVAKSKLENMDTASKVKRILSGEGFVVENDKQLPEWAYYDYCPARAMHGKGNHTNECLGCENNLKERYWPQVAEYMPGMSLEINYNGRLL